MVPLKERYRGLLLGTAAGDAVGLPAEGISRRRAGRMFRGLWRHRLVFGHGMISDDTEHALFVTQCLLAYSDSPALFGRRMANCLRWWFASLPAGIGLATARACVKLWLGCGYRGSGVRSAGNGPAMRAAPIGAFFAGTGGELDAFSAICTRITHTDPKALTGARAVAAVAAWIVREDLTTRPPVDDFCRLLECVVPADDEWRRIVRAIGEGLRRGASVDDFARTMGLASGVTGYIYHTVPVALFAWHRHFAEYRNALSAIYDCGGDTDTCGAVCGALAGLTVGERGIPKEWIDGIWDWPRSTDVLRRVADRLAELREGGTVAGPVRYCWPGLALRNVFFLAVVLVHGFRRLLPPY